MNRNKISDSYCPKKVEDMADKPITDAGVIEEIRAAMPVVTASKNGLANMNKAIESSYMRIDSYNSWIRIAKLSSSISPGAGIISISNEWNYNNASHVVFIITALCRQTSSLTVLHNHKINGQLVIKTRVVKTTNEGYIDIYVAGRNNNAFYISFSATSHLSMLPPYIVEETQSGYEIEEFDLTK